MFLGVDGGGTKTAFVLIDEEGHVRARHAGGSSYYPEVGLEQTSRVINAGIEAIVRDAGISTEQIRYAFLGVPAYGEDSKIKSSLDELASGILTRNRYVCGNDMVCSWAGALACSDGISVIAGTGSIAYGQFAGREARAGGWGELFSDEGSAYWIAREGLNAFSRMSDGRAQRSALYDLIRTELALEDDIDLCAYVYGDGQGSRRNLAQVAPVVAVAADAGDELARGILHRAGVELANLAKAVRSSLDIPTATDVKVSYTGGVFARNPRVLDSFSQTLCADPSITVEAPMLSPALGAALYAGRLAGISWSTSSLQALRAYSQRVEQQL